MEWNKEKRELMAQSTSCTVGQAEKKLDKAVHVSNKHTGISLI